jgi:peptidoglycan/LPS O-acetylase OafA/YrhL
MTASATKYRADIDGLRAIAVGAVLVYHAFPAVLKGGFTGVDVFFVISGYLISGIILDGVAGGRFTFAHFYARRIRRIFPALTVTLAAVMAAGWFWLYADDYARLSRHTAAGAAFVANIVLWRESSYFDVAADLKPLLHLWSLGIEEQFYLVWPLLLVAIERDAGFGARLQHLQMRAPIRGLQSVLGLVMVAAGMLLIDSTRVFPGLWALLPAAGTVLLILAGADAPVNRTLLSWRPMVWIGLISYPLYLWHWPLLSFAYILLGEVPPPALAIALLVLSVALARATYLLIERPIRFGTPSRIAIPGLAIAMTAICAFAAVVAVSGGMIDRAVNRNDAAHLVNYYARMRQSQIAAAYRRECDFMEWQTERTRDEIDRSCTVAGQAHTIFLWGDSFAQSLSLGLRESAPPGTSVAQVATSACRAAVDDFDLAVKDRRCEKANRYALEAIRRLRPDIVVIAQQNRHDRTDWEKLIAAVIELGAAHVVVVGPLPAWPQGLPSIYADRHMTDHADYLADGLEPALFDVDRRLAARLAGRGDATYLSVLEQLCRDGACLARVPGADPLDLMALDFGHLTPKGSSYLGRVLWKPYLERAIK